MLRKHKMKRRDADTEMNRMVAGWSTKMLEEVANLQDFEDAEDMVQWRCICQEGKMICRRSCVAKWRRKRWRSFFNQKGQRRTRTRDEVSRWSGESSQRIQSVAEEQK